MSDGGERRMLFDTRGRRKNVIRVVYAVLALLMGTSLFFVIGPVNVGEIIGNSASSSASEALDDRVERIEARLAKNPNDEQLLLTLTRTQIAAGNSKLEPGPEGQPQPVTPEASEDFQAARDSWNRYLKQAGDEPNPALAQLVAATFFTLAETGSFSIEEIELNMTDATQAQRIAADARPNLGSISTLAIYEFFAGNFAIGDKTVKQAAALAPNKAEAKNVEKQLDEYRKRAKRFEKSAKEFAKSQQAQQGSGQEQPQNPFGLGPPGSTPGE